jgi:hypothetical protein
MKKEQIKKIIEAAFNGVTLDGGISLEQTKVIDNYGRGVSVEEFTALPNNEVTNNWKQIPISQLDEAECLAHFDRKGFKYYIPALMLRLLENYDPESMMTIGTLSILYPETETWAYLYTLLTEEQYQAIALFLKELPNLVELDTFEDKKVVERAFNNYWSKFVLNI